MGLILRLLGGLTIELDREIITSQIPTKSAILLAYIAQEQKVCERDTIATRFWQNSTPKQALSNLRTVLSHLRHHIKPYLTVTSKTIALNETADIWVDSVMLHHQLTDLASQPLSDNNLKQLQQILKLYQGPFLESVFVRNTPAFDRWAEAWRHKLHQLVLKSRQNLLSYHQQQGNHKAAIQHAHALLQDEPTHEQAHHQLMILLARQGQTDAALAQYQSYKQILAEELSVEPNPATAALYERIRVHRHNPLRPLPQPHTSFIGRQAELATLIRQLQEPEHRLVSIVGLGGIGKTRLALQVAQQVNLHFLHGVVFVPLAAIEDPAFIDEQIIDSLHITLPKADTPQKTLLTYLQDKHLLLILDNVEHLARQNSHLITRIKHILKQAPNINILVTTREPLYLQTEQQLQLQGLTNTHQATATQLFVDRAQAIEPDFQQTNDNRQAIKTICQLVGGMPLAIELAAGWVNLMSCTEIAAELTKNIDLLATPLQDVPPRQKSLQAVMEAVWQNLEANTQQLLARLSLFQGAFTPAAAQTITTATPSQLRTLLDKGLLQQAQPKRYLIPQALRHFTQEKLAQLESTIATADEARHGRYYLDLLKNFPDQAISIVRHEQGNIRTALSWAAKQQAWEPLRQAIAALTALYQAEKTLSHKTSFFQVARQHLEKIQQDQQTLNPLITNLLKQLQSISPQTTLPTSIPKQATLPQRYQIHEHIGQGGMGHVYRVTDRLTGDTLALKQITLSNEPQHPISYPPTNRQDDLKLALAHEFQVMASLHHPHILSVLDYGFDKAGNPFFTMPYLAQAQTFLQAGRSQDNNSKLHLLHQLVQALHYLHQRGIIHRDLKPSNILIQQGVVKVLDFGLSLSHEQNKQLSGGTPPYLAPEIWLKQAYSLATDMYAVGILAFQLFASHDASHPFEPLDDSFLQRVTKATPPWQKLTCHHDIIHFISQLLAKSPAHRPQAATALHTLSQLLKQPPPESSAIRESYLQAATFVGREAERKQLSSLLAQVKTGKPQAVLISGESGIGKSRLINEIRIQALVDGFIVLQGQAIQESSLPYQLWQNPVRHLCLTTDLTPLAASVLQSVVPNLADLLAQHIQPAPILHGLQAQQRLYTIITDLFLQQSHPTLLLLEDLQWAEESLEVLTSLLRNLLHQPSTPSTPILIIGTYRTEERPLLPQQFPQATHIQLERLTDKDIQTLCQNILGKTNLTPHLVNFLQQQSEGNTFFLIEIIRTLAQQAGRLANIAQMSLPATIFPAGITTILNQRLTLLPNWAKPLLNLAAIAGRQLDLPLIQHLAGETIDLETEWLPIMAEVNLLSVTGTTWQFAHDKLRESLLHQLNTTTQQKLHHQVATALESLYPQDASQAAHLMRHWGGAGNTQKERLYAQQAGIYAQTQHAYQDALTYWKRAEQLLPVDNTSEQYQVYMAQEAIYARLGHREIQKRKLAQLQTISKKLDTTKQGQLTLRQAKYAAATSNYDQAITHGQKAIKLSQQSHNTSLTIAAHHLLGETHVDNSHYANAQTHYQAGLQLAQETKDFPQAALCLVGLGSVAYYQGDHLTAQQYWKQALTIQQQHKDQLGQGHTLNNLGVATIAQENYTTAQDHLTQALTIWQAVGDRHWQGLILSNLGGVALRQGHQNTAQTYFQQALAIFQKIEDKHGQGVSLNNLGGIAKKQGNMTMAQKILPTILNHQATDR